MLAMCFELGPKGPHLCLPAQKHLLAKDGQQVSAVDKIIAPGAAALTHSRPTVCRRAVRVRRIGRCGRLLSCALRAGPGAANVSLGGTAGVRSAVRLGGDARRGSCSASACGCGSAAVAAAAASGALGRGRAPLEVGCDGQLQLPKVPPLHSACSGSGGSVSSADAQKGRDTVKRSGEREGKGEEWTWAAFCVCNCGRNVRCDQQRRIAQGNCRHLEKCGGVRVCVCEREMMERDALESESTFSRLFPRFALQTHTHTQTHETAPLYH